MKPTVIIIQIPLAKGEVTDRSFTILDELVELVADNCQITTDEIEIQMLETWLTNELSLTRYIPYEEEIFQITYAQDYSRAFILH